MKKIFPLLLIIIFAACSGGNLETIELKEEDGTTVRFTRDKENFAKEGLLTKTRIDGSIIEEAEYTNDTLDGFRKLYYPNGKLQITETYQNGVFQGNYQSFYENGQLQLEGEYIKNSMEGTWKGYYDSGELKEEVFFKNNNENGPFVEYHKNGNAKTKGQYLDGDNEDGLLQMFNEEGELVKKMNCEKRICRTIWTKEDGDVIPEKINIPQQQ